MNILFLCDEYPPCQHGGIGTVTQLLARTLVKKGHNIYVAGFYPYYRSALKEEVDCGVQVYRFFYGSKLLLKLSKHMFFGRFFNIKKEFNKYNNFIKKIIKSEQIEIIELPDYQEVFRYSGSLNIQYQDFGVPKVIKLHGNNSYFNFVEKNIIPSRIIFEKEKQHINSASGIIALSEYVKSKVQTIFQTEIPIKLIYNGLDVNFLGYYSKNENQNFTIVFAGTLTEKKGIFSLLKSWNIVEKKISNAKLIIYGKGSEKSIELINKLINDEKLNSVELKGFISKDELPQVYVNCSCAIFPSYAESFSMAPMEAMIVGCPVIFSNRTSGPELINNGIDGLLIDPDNFKEIADAILFMIEKRSSAIEMGRIGSQRIKKYFDIIQIAEQHIEYYNSIIESE